VFNPSKNPKRQLDDSSFMTHHPKVIFAVQVDIYFHVNISFYNFKWPKHVESLNKMAQWNLSALTYKNHLFSL